jgi:hypothetical protein
MLCRRSSQTRSTLGLQRHSGSNDEQAPRGNRRCSPRRAEPASGRMTSLPQSWRSRPVRSRSERTFAIRVRLPVGLTRANAGVLGSVGSADCEPEARTPGACWGTERRQAAASRSVSLAHGMSAIGTARLFKRYGSTLALDASPRGARGEVHAGSERSRQDDHPPAARAAPPERGRELFPSARQGATARRPAPERHATAGSPARGRPPPRSAGPRPCSRGSGSSGPCDRAPTAQVRAPRCAAAQPGS